MESAEAIEMLTGMVWGVVAVICGFYFIGCYLLEILAQKLDEPRWMAWVPLVNFYLTYRLAGLGGWFGAMIAGWVLAGVIAAVSPGFALILVVPLLIATLVLNTALWFLIAKRRQLSPMIGVLMLLPNVAGLLDGALGTGVVFSLLFSALGLLAFLYLVFYDGLPEQSPHIAGYVVTTCMAALIALPILYLADDPEFLEGFQEGFAAAQAGETADGEEIWSDFGLDVLESAASDSEPAREAIPNYQPPADTCAGNAREGGARPPEGNHWWCEAMIGGVWERHGPVRKWFDHGGVESEGTYKAGLEDGTWSRYWKTGGAKVRADFVDGQQHGWMRTWDEVGRLESEVYYEYGQPTTAPASN